MKFHHNRRAFGLKEIIIVIALLGVVFLMAAPLLLNSRESARRNTCLFRQKLLADALIAYDEDLRELPGYANLLDAAVEPPIDTGWLFPALPYLQSRIYPTPGEMPPPPYLEEFQAYSADGELAGQVPDFTVYEAICPDDAPDEDPEQWGGVSSFVVNSGMPDVPPSGEIPADWAANGIFQNRLHQKKGVAFEQFTLQQISELDGLEMTLLLGENVDAGSWTSSTEADVSFLWSNDADAILGINQQTGQGDGSARFSRLSSYHPGGVNLMFGSGAGKFVNERVDAILFAQMQATDDAQAKVAGSDQLVWPAAKAPAVP
ncbi:DUF1559 domain-containing protein [Blastopirellula sp. J2-11]|uniref:DUF1559 family PulG-like putative transporter n=1 Tax=Blastopirellula sp. J2-11 TaxID=2943192 RepID=UPI0021C59ED8|nr:DUF1559 domain-containing protein [Blastopirellula sp. J2-11]UUO08362.1 DUF1559 domain-containing protein [Blastopirellula sp. J2-11]